MLALSSSCVAGGRDVRSKLTFEVLVKDLLEIGGQTHPERLSTCDQGKRSSQILHNQISSFENTLVVTVIGKVFEDELAGRDKSYGDGSVYYRR